MSDKRLMKKLNLLGLGNENGRSYFYFEKNLDFFSTFPIFFERLNLDKVSRFYAYDEKILDLKETVDIYENAENTDYDVDIFFGEKRIIVVVRTSHRNKLRSVIKEIATHPGFD